MNEEELKRTVFKELKRIAPDTEPETLGPDDDIRRTLDIDSFDFLQFIVALTGKTGIDIPEQDYGKIATLKGMLKYFRVKA